MQLPINTGATLFLVGHQTGESYTKKKKKLAHIFCLLGTIDVGSIADVGRMENESSIDSVGHRSKLLQSPTRALQVDTKRNFECVRIKTIFF